MTRLNSAWSVMMRWFWGCFSVIMITTFWWLLLCHLWAKIGALAFSQQACRTQAKVTWTNKTIHYIPSLIPWVTLGYIPLKRLKWTQMQYFNWSNLWWHIYFVRKQYRSGLFLKKCGICWQWTKNSYISIYADIAFKNCAFICLQTFSGGVNSLS